MAEEKQCVENGEKKEKIIKARVFNIMQYERHKETGEELINELMIKNGLGYKSIMEYAYIRHDKDRDEYGQIVPPHWHIVLRCPNQPPLKSISKWFNIAENFVDLPKGRDAFGDCVAYLTHEECTESYKHKYSRGEVVANFSVEEFWNKRIEEKTKYGRSLCEEEKLFVDVLEKGKSLRECQTENPLLYIKHLNKLKQLRCEYLSNAMPPALRINIYVSGNGGIGKDLLCRAIARSYFPDYEDEDDIYYNVGAKGVPFDDYDGQPVIIWSDRRASDLIFELGSRGNVFEIFDSHPKKKSQNIKYGKVNLINCINIINSVESKEDFLNGLAGEYTDRNGVLRKTEDKNQAYRRFPIVTELSYDEYKMYVNKGWLDDAREFDSLIAYGQFRNNLVKSVEKWGEKSEKMRILEKEATKPITDKCREFFDRQEEVLDDEDEFQRMLAEAGKRIDNESISSGHFEVINDNPFSSEESKKIHEAFETMRNVIRTSNDVALVMALQEIMDKIDKKA